MNDVLVGFGWESSKKLSDASLLAEVTRVSRAHGVLTAELVAHLAEMDARKLYLREATPSMFVYCVKRLGFSEDEACRRIDAARMVQKWPGILRKIGSGELSLTVLGKLKAVLNESGGRTRSEPEVNELVEAVSGMSVRDAERVLAARFPKPDVPDSIRKLPNREPTVSAKQDPLTGTTRTMETELASGAVARTEPADTTVTGRASATEPGSAFENPPVVATKPATATESAATATESAATATESAATASIATGTGERVAPRPVDRGRFQPLSAERIQVKFTASRELEEKIALARDLMSHRNPRGDLATIFEAALDLWIKDALKKKLGVTDRPQNAPRDSRRGEKPREPRRARVTHATRREVLERDGLGCTFVNEKGERCGARAFLELDHRKAKATGGGPEPENMRLLCRAHNQGEAERVYGKAHMERSRRRGKKRDEGLRERTATREFVVGLVNPRRRGYSSSAGRTVPREWFASAAVLWCSAVRARGSSERKQSRTHVSEAGTLWHRPRFWRSRVASKWLDFVRTRDRAR